MLSEDLQVKYLEQSKNNAHDAISASARELVEGLHTALLVIKLRLKMKHTTFNCRQINWRIMHLKLLHRYTSKSLHTHP